MGIKTKLFFINKTVFLNIHPRNHYVEAYKYKQIKPLSKFTYTVNLENLQLHVKDIVKTT